jgi:tetratricopeptide (TPR) repeat protein
MRADEWEKIKELFERALQFDESERRAFLVEACQSRPELLPTVEELLANHLEDRSASLRHAGIASPVFQHGVLLASRYRVIRFIARGGMGEVYEAFDERLRIRLALKTLRSELTADPEAIGRFKREIVVARNVSHPSICRIFDLVDHQGVSGPVPILSMELLEGESLAERLERSRPLPATEALAFAGQIAAGLDCLHQQGIIHRDLKPSNIMLARRQQGAEQAVLTDFGLAKACNPDCELFETKLNLAAGAPYFMAPELLKEGQPDRASDIYSFGLVIDEMITRSRAYSAQSLQALYFAKLWEEPEPPSRRADGLPPNWQAVVLKCLDRVPGRRYASASAAVAGLQISPALAWALPKPTRRRMITVPAVAGVMALGALALRRTMASLEVFQIENRTGSAELDVLSKGVTLELIRRLQASGAARIVPRYATRTKGATPAAEFSLDGYFAVQGGAGKLIVQIVDNRSVTPVWRGSFDLPGAPAEARIGEPHLDEMTAAALRTVDRYASSGEATVAGGGWWSWWDSWRTGQIQAIKAPTSSPAALDHYLRGYALLQEVNADSVDGAEQELLKAVEIDPRFALAFSALAQARVYRSNYSVGYGAGFVAEARQFAERAVREDPQLPEAHAVLGIVNQRQWDWESADHQYLEALRLKPSFALARRWRAGLVLQFARFEEALGEMERAAEEDPFDRGAVSGRGLALMLAGRYREAISYMEKAVAGKEHPGARHNLGQTYARLGSLSVAGERAALFRSALREAETVAAIEARRPKAPRLLSDSMFALFHSLAGDPALAGPYLGNVLERARLKQGSPLFGAWAYAAQRRVDEALDLVEQSYDLRDPMLIYLKVNPFLENLFPLPRFRQVLNSLHLA